MMSQNHTVTALAFRCAESESCAGLLRERAYVAPRPRLPEAP